MQRFQLQQQRYLAAAVALGLDGHVTATVGPGGATGPITPTAAAATANGGGAAGDEAVAAVAAAAAVAAVAAVAAGVPGSPRMSSFSSSSPGGGVGMPGGGGAAGHSNLSYRPLGNPAAEPAAAAAARLGRLVAAIGARHGAGNIAVAGSGTGSDSPRASARVSGSLLLSTRSPRVHEHQHYHQQQQHHRTHQAFAHLPLGVAEPAPWAPAGGDAEDTEAGEASSDLGSREVTASGGIVPTPGAFAGGGSSAFAAGSGALAAAVAAASARSRSASLATPSGASPRPMTAPAGPADASPGRGRSGSSGRLEPGSPPGGGLGGAPPSSPFAPPQQLYLAAKKEEEAAAAAALAATRAANSPFAADGVNGSQWQQIRQSQQLAGLSSSSLVPRLDFSRLRVNGSTGSPAGGLDGSGQISGVVSYDPDADVSYGGTVHADGTAAGPRGSLALGSPSVRQLKWAVDHGRQQGEGEGEAGGGGGEEGAGAHGSPRRQGSGLGTDDSGTDDGEGGGSPRGARQLGSPSSRCALRVRPCAWLGGRLSHMAASPRLHTPSLPRAVSGQPCVPLQPPPPAPGNNRVPYSRKHHSPVALYAQEFKVCFLT